MLGPHAAVGEPGVQSVPRIRHRRTVAVGHGGGGGRGRRPGGRVGEVELRPVPRWATGTARRRRREAQHPVPAHPSQHDHRQIDEGERQPGQVVAFRRRSAGCPGRRLGGGRPPADVRRRSGSGWRSRRSGRRRGAGAPRRAPPSTRCGPVRARRRTSTASRGSVAPVPCRGRRRGRTTAADSSGREGRSQALTSTANTIAPSRSRGIDSAPMTFRRGAISIPP